MNEKQIFQTLKDATANKREANSQYFIFESLQIFYFLLTTLQKSQLLENEDEYLEFI